MNVSTTVPVSAGLYVLAWLAGLFVAPARPSDGATGAVKEYFLQHSGAAVTQSVLVHGVAGLAVAAFAWSLSRLVDRSSGAVLTLGVVAAALSLIQVAILLMVATRAESLSSATVDQRVGWIDTVDTAKLAALAAFAVVASTAAVASNLTQRWMVPFAVALALLLVAGGVSFFMSSSLLTSALYLALPLLLLWVGVLGVTVARAVPPAAAAVDASKGAPMRSAPQSPR